MVGIHAGALAAFKLRSIAPGSIGHGSTRAGMGFIPTGQRWQNNPVSEDLRWGVVSFATSHQRGVEKSFRREENTDTLARSLTDEPGDIQQSSQE